MDERRVFTPAEIARRVAALGVIINPATVWAYLRGRAAGTALDRVGPTATELVATEEEVAWWLDEFLDVVEAERLRLTRNMRRSSADDAEGGRPPE